MLPGAGFRDDSSFTHSLYQETLAHYVVYLMRSSVVQVFTLDVDARAAEGPGQVLRVAKRRGSTGIRFHQMIELIPKARIGSGAFEGGLQLVKSRHQYLRQKRPPKFSKIASI